jgi:predicted pyridoxine 5'-phosphate oxidase superfamily flavin-nucleotide-binding protein
MKTPIAPFHAGEVSLQSATGMRERMEAIGPRIIRDHMPDQHREFFEQLPTLIVGSLGGDGQPWATLVHGSPGFVRAPDDRTLRIASYPAVEDPARAGLREGAPVGLLGIEAHTRRRNRANGAIVAAEAGSWSVRVLQSFGNCPRYIHERQPFARPGREPEPPSPEVATLSAEARALISQSDTMFIASSSARKLSKADLASSPGAGVDVSHRGGPAGFIAIERRGSVDELTVPDYAGNSMFNTLGNLLVWPLAGLLFLDLERGHMLQLAATAAVSADDPAIVRFPGALRLLKLSVLGGWMRRAAIPLAWA